MRKLAAIARKRTIRAAGLMSGTSADGVDACVADVSARGAKVVAFETRPYPRAVREAVLRMASAERVPLDDLCRLNFRLGEIFAEALLALCRNCRIDPASIDLIGSHGQTVRHLPSPEKFLGADVRATLQLGEPSVIAERTGITTVADFRCRDLAAGGQGAPLVPHADKLLFGHPEKTRVIQNIGGIANVTYLPPTGSGKKLIAFDTGPGNMVIDHLVRTLTRGRQQFDRDGKLAARGQVDTALVSAVMRGAYFRKKPPKSAGRKEFGGHFAEKLLSKAARRRLGKPDIIATATALTARSIVDAWRRFLPRRIDEAILSGGGARNPVLVSMIEELTDMPVLIFDALGIDADAREALSFAVLAVETIRGAPNNCPSSTGASRAVVLGKVVPA